MQTYNLVCQYQPCGKAFTANYPEAKTCSNKCKVKLIGLNRKDPSAPHTRFKIKVQKKRLVKRYDEVNPNVMFECVICGKEYFARKIGGRDTCSAKCRREKNKRNGVVENE